MVRLSYDKERVARAKDLRTRWYNGEKTERTPFTYGVPSDVTGVWQQGCPYNFREVITDSVKAVEGFMLSIQHQFDTFPDCDYIPLFNPFYLGEGILAAMYGAEQYIVDDNPPYTNNRLYRDIYDAQKLNNDFEIEKTEWGVKLKEHVVRFTEAAGGEIPVGVADYQSPYGTATKLIPNEELMLAMYDAPDLVHNFLSVITNGIIKLVEAMERWIGRENLAHNPTNPIPGKCGIILWDDYVSVLNPALHTEFCAPYNKKLYDRFGRGHLHTCGPYFPSFIDACLECGPRSMDASIMRGQGKSREDMAAFLKITSKKNIRLFGGLKLNDKSIFEKGSYEADDELLADFIRGGYFPASGGSYEDGLRFAEKINRIDQGL